MDLVDQNNVFVNTITWNIGMNTSPAIFSPDGQNVIANYIMCKYNLISFFIFCSRTFESI